MWARILNTVLGLWLMIAPALFQYSGAAADNGHIAGPVIITFAVIAYWEATRGTRKWNYPIGIWLLLAPWILGYDNSVAIISDMTTGALVLIFASVKGKIEKKYGGGWSSLWSKNPEHMKNLDKH